ncbi:MAG: hypothetical protein IJP25_02135 [Elusimicrobiaceae bacterium]|nr:hypothetical protein [Elusimicrobiaceae bacterium]
MGIGRALFLVLFLVAEKEKVVFLLKKKRETFLKQCGYPCRKSAEKEGVSRPRLDPFFFFLTICLIGRQEELKCCLLAENLFIRGFV